jgi:hypothetical protein
MEEKTEATVRPLIVTVDSTQFATTCTILLSRLTDYDKKKYYLKNLHIEERDGLFYGNLELAERNDYDDDPTVSRGVVVNE